MSGTLGAPEILDAAEQCRDFLQTAVSADWTVRVPDLEMTAAEVVAHAAETSLWYAIDLSARGTDLKVVEHLVKPEGRPEDLIDTLTAYAAVLASVVAAAPEDARGFHPQGMADPSGFAAMACYEMLVHTDDAGRALNLTFAPSAGLADAVLRRLFPWAPSEGEPWTVLKWANGRIALGDRKSTRL